MRSDGKISSGSGFVNSPRQRRLHSARPLALVTRSSLLGTGTTMHRIHSHSTVDDLRPVLDDKNVTGQALT
jgi:hypothetical protein